MFPDFDPCRLIAGLLRLIALLAVLLLIAVVLAVLGWCRPRPFPTPAAMAAGEQHDTDSFTARSAVPARRGSIIFLPAGARTGAALSHDADAVAGREQTSL